MLRETTLLVSNTSLILLDVTQLFPHLPQAMV